MAGAAILIVVVLLELVGFALLGGGDLLADWARQSEYLTPK